MKCKIRQFFLLAEIKSSLKNFFESIRREDYAKQMGGEQGIILENSAQAVPCIRSLPCKDRLKANCFCSVCAGHCQNENFIDFADGFVGAFISIAVQKVF